MPISEIEDSMMYDYLDKMQGSKAIGESTHFSGNLYHLQFFDNNEILR